MHKFCALLSKAQIEQAYTLGSGLRFDHMNAKNTHYTSKAQHVKTRNSYKIKVFRN
jgi:hypothetical protein